MSPTNKTRITICVEPETGRLVEQRQTLTGLSKSGLIDLVLNLVFSAPIDEAHASAQEELFKRALGGRTL